MSSQEILTILAEVKELKDLMADMKDIPAAIDFMNAKFEAAMAELKEAKKELVKAKKEKEKLQNTINSMQTTISHMETKMNSLANQQLANNLEIVGVPVTNNEVCADIAIKVARKAHPEMKRKEISEAYRIGRLKNEDGTANVNRSLVVKFKSVAMRNTVYKNKKALKGVTAKDLDLGQATNRIYINENLNYETKSLMREANQFKKDNGWNYIWTNFGIIYVRENDKSKSYAITSKKDLEVLLSL